MKRYKTAKKSGRKDQDRGDLHSPVKPTRGRRERRSIRNREPESEKMTTPVKPTYFEIHSSVDFQQKTQQEKGRREHRLNRRRKKRASVNFNRSFVFKSSDDFYPPVKPMIFEKSVGASTTASLEDSVLY
jgi:hypothetical protein